MAVHRNLENIFSGEASGDLSTNQYRIAVIDDNGQIAIPATGATIPCGILLNKPAATGRAARIAGPGSIVKCEAGAAINERDPIQAVAGGRGSAAAGGTNTMFVGYAVSAAAGSGSLFEVLVQPGRGVQ